MGLIAISIFTLTLAADIYTDLRRWDSGKINHKRGALIRIAALGVVAIFNWHTVVLWPLYGILFDFGLNIGRKLPLFYIGNTSALDRLQNKYPGLIGVKWALGVFGVIIYVILN